MEAEDLKTWRKERKISQDRLAELLAVARNTVSRWEIGERGIPPFLLLALQQIDANLKAGKPEN